MSYRSKNQPQDQKATPDDNGNINDNNNQELAANYNEGDTDALLEDYEDDQRFVKLEDQQNAMDNAADEIFHDIIADLEKFRNEQSGVRPNSFQNRSLSHEHGGLEVEEHDGVSKEDAWDGRSEEIQDMGEESYEQMTDASTSSIRKSFIHRKKQDKKRNKRRREEVEEEMEAAKSMSDLLKPKKSHADKVKERRSESKGGGGMQLF
tara:strand:+ start:2586 stop:3206 length:621 start_codon:yes stop_codon:yes gene_type:complete